MSSKFLFHEPCPRCNSRNNLGVFDDEHKYCFGCGYFEAGYANVKQVFASPVERRETAFPYDASSYIPSVPLKWLLSCNISYEKQARYNIQWSERQQLVCWQIKTPDGRLLGWQGRTFNPEAHIKYVSHGKIREEACILGQGNDVVVLCEDYLSAINIAEAGTPAMPLFGCTCHLNVLQGVAKRFKQVWVWLDSDKLANSRHIAFKASLLGSRSRVIYSAKDPKQYSKQEIERLLYGV